MSPSSLFPQTGPWKKLGWKTWMAAIVTPLLVAATAPWWMGPACPKRVVIATGSPTGAYYATACRYREILAEQGISLEIRATAGSQENIELLSDPDNDVSIALVQGGLAPESQDSAITSLASVYLEPIWVFYTGETTIDQFLQLAGKQVAIGEVGSGTRPLAEKLLQENGLLGPAANHTPVKAISLGGRAAAEALKRGELDAAMFVISPQSPLIRELLADKNVRLMSFERAEAYARRMPFFTNTTLPEGAIDLSANLPESDVQLLAVTANLVGRKKIHSALVPLLMKAAFEVHESGDMLSRREAFPSLYYMDFPVNYRAKRYFKSGPSFFYRYLPFTLAAWLDHLKLLLLPLCTLLFPLVKAAPPLYRWRIRSKIYRWYRVLRDIDQQLRMSQDDHELAEKIDTNAQIEKLRRMENELAEVSVPLSYMEEFYNLRLHVAFVLHRLESREKEQSAPLLRHAA